MKLCSSKAEQLKPQPSMKKGHTGFKWSDESKKNISGPNSRNWKGGLQKSAGCVYVLMPEHPNGGVRKCVSRARLVMEEYL